MPEYVAPGVYVEEVDTGIKTIEGVSTSVAGFVGLTRRGRVTGLPQLVTSFNEFQRMFGGFADFTFGAQYNNLPYAVDGFFANGGRQLFVDAHPQRWRGRDEADHERHDHAPEIGHDRADRAGQAGPREHARRRRHPDEAPSGAG